MTESDRGGPEPDATSGFPVDSFLRIQEAELQIKSAEVNRRRQADRDEFAFAAKSLDLQAQNLREVRQHDSRKRVHLLTFAGVASIALLVFLGLCVYWDKDQIALEIVKGTIFLGTGFLGGRGYQSLFKKTERDG